MILIVDDDEDVRSTIGHCLDVLAYPYREASSGAAAVEETRQRRFQLVILDHLMPGISGVEAAEQIAAIDPTLPVVFATGHAEEAAIRKVALEGVPILHKPFKLAEMAELIETCSRRD